MYFLIIDSVNSTSLSFLYQMHFANKRNLDLGLAKVFNYFFAEKDERKRRNEKCNIFLLTSRKPAANLRKRVLSQCLKMTKNVSFSLLFIFVVK